MPTNNLTTRSGMIFPAAVGLWPTRGEDTRSPGNNDNITDTAPDRHRFREGTLLVVVACLLASNWRLRHKGINSARPRKTSNVQSELPVRSTAKLSALMLLLDRGLRMAAYVAVQLLKLFSGRIGSGPQKQGLHTRPEGLPQKPETVTLDNGNSERLERKRPRTECATGELSLSPRGAPRHVAVIMDGNRRFGRVKYGDPLKGHSDGGKRLGEFLEWCMEAGVAVATAFAFSTENWKRDAHEVKLLMDLVCTSCGELMEDAGKKNMRIRVLASDATKLPERVLTAIQKAEDATKDCTGFLFNICLSYGARQEMANACQQIAQEVASGVTSLDLIDEYAVERHLLTKGLPDPDLLIRTSGEKRVSNFLLFQMAYTELFFVDKLWPDITRRDVLDIFEAFKTRKRRFGC
ncbi:unnamed protein product [Ectocarpus sp. 12 AP-2014]